MHLEIKFLVFLITLIVSFFMTKLVRVYFLGRSILDYPNNRSSHVTPTPTGGGIPILCVFFGCIGILQLYGYIVLPNIILLLILTIVLAFVSFLDDIFGLNVLFRLLVQVGCAWVAVSNGLIEGGVFGNLLAPLFEKIVIVILWVWFMNLCNFMDGIDGIVGVQALAIGLGVFILSSSLDLSFLGLILAGAMGGFLIMNWQPAKIFLGDVGSVPVGFLAGWLLFSLSSEGNLIATVILPLYFIIDSSFTLIIRLVKFEKVWEPHRDHFYQKAVSNGKSHSEISFAVAVTNLLLIGLLAFVDSDFGFWVVICGLGIVGILIFWMVAGPKRKKGQ